MSDKYRIDSHKLMFHVSRVRDWRDGKPVYPIYMEISPSGICNHRCVFCGLDFMEYQKRFLDTAILKERLTELGSLGLKSVMYCGEGEPFLHKDIAEIINHTKSSGIDVAASSNGVLFRPELAESVLGVMSWLKISINAGTSATYSKIHNTKAGDFDTVIGNITRAVEIKREKGYKCTLGFQLLLLPDNKEEATTLARIARDIGVDYLVVKPYSQHPQSKTKIHDKITYAETLTLEKELAEFNTDRFQVIFRGHSMRKRNEGKRPYQHCLSLPFWAYLDSGGNIWGCLVFLKDDRFYYGNIYENTIEEIWMSERRKEAVRWAECELDASKCRINCRMDEVNRYLWELKHPSEHVNFI